MNRQWLNWRYRLWLWPRPLQRFKGGPKQYALAHKLFRKVARKFQ